MKIGTCKAATGRITRGKLTVAVYRGKELRIPVLIAKGDEPGKTVFISAGIHGDEINGIEVVRNFIQEINPEKLDGTIIFLPILNPWGFRRKSRYIPFDNKDLNRCFNINGRSVSYKIAKTLMKKVISKCDFGIDLHDGRTNLLLPHTRIFKRNKCKYLKELSHAFGSEIILQREGERGMMAIESFNAYKTPVLTVEVGGALVLREDFTTQVLNGLKNILVYGGLLNGVLDLPVKQFFLDDRLGYVAPIRGILHIEVELGDAVKKGQLIAKIHNPVNDKEVIIKSKNPGVVFSVRRDAIINKGESILSILHFKVERRRKGLVPLQAKMLINRTKPEEVITRPTIIIDNVLSLLGLSYKIVGESLKESLRVLDEYFKLAKHKH